MKKYFLIITALLFCVIYANADSDADSLVRISGLHSGDYRIMSGFEFKEYEPSAIGLETKVNAEIANVISDDNTQNQGNNVQVTPRNPKDDENDETPNIEPDNRNME